MWGVRCISSRVALGASHKHHLFIGRRLSSNGSKPSISPGLFERAKTLTAEHSRLSSQLDKGYDADVAKQAGSLSGIASSFKAWEDANKSLSELKGLISDPSTDSELRSLASEELSQTAGSLESLSNSLKASLVPDHPFASLPCLLEIRPGVGGDEAALFAGDLYRMYQAYFKLHSLPYRTLSLETAGAISNDRIVEAVLEITSPGAYDRLRCEAGVHRVQRVPATETKGRTHTSAVSVLVLPSFPARSGGGGGEDSESSFDDPESDYYVNPREVRTDTMRASGAGGQHVNRTDSAVRLTHLPTGTVVRMETSRSQHKNRDDAWRLLRARLAQSRREEREEEMSRMRTSALGGVARTGRGDKVRTYNWSQQRVTDHRSGLTVNRLEDVLEGGLSLGEVMRSVGDWLKEKDLEALDAEEEAKKGR